MSYSQPCDTFFVEDNTFQQQQQQSRPNTQEYIKMMGRRRQEAMANELSRQACDAYMDDIIDHMASMEVIDLTLANFMWPCANVIQ